METIDLGIEGLDEIEEIGRGGSSRVYRAKQVELDRTIALKVLNARADGDVARRFDRERKAMGRLSDHVGIVPVYSTGVTNQGEPYLIMPYYPAGSLQHRLEAGPLDWDEAVACITSAARTMAAAHDADVVHLDLKPANIMLAPDGSPRIADFGIARLSTDPTSPNTADSPFTPAYSAPETLVEGLSSPASDVYGLAATLWALIAGRSPFRSPNGDNSVMAVIGRAVHSQVEDLRPRVPDPIWHVIVTGMAKHPDDRYQTAGGLADALASALDDVKSGGHLKAAASNTPTIDPPPGHLLEHDSFGHDSGVPAFIPVREEPGSKLVDLLDRLPVAPLAAVSVVMTVALLLGLQLVTSGSNGDDPSADNLSAAGEIGSSTLDDADVRATMSSDANALGGFDQSSSTRPGADDSNEDQRTSTTERTTITEPESSATTSDSSSSSDSLTTPSDSSSSDPSSSDSSSPTDSSATSEPTPTSTPEQTQLNPPQDVTAETGLVGSVEVKWQPPRGVAPEGYTVFRDGSAVGTTDGTSFVDSDLMLGLLYKYKVRADGPPGNSEFSNEVSVTLEL